MMFGSRSFSECSRTLSDAVSVDLSGVNHHKCFIVHTLKVEDLEHPAVTNLLSNPACSDVKLQFSRNSEDETALLGSV